MKRKVQTREAHANPMARIPSMWPDFRTVTPAMKAHPATTTTTLPVVHGITHDGVAVFTDGAVSRLGIGRFWQMKPFKGKNGGRGYLFIPLSNDMDTRLEGEPEVEIRCVDAGTAERLLFKGILIEPASDHAKPSAPVQSGQDGSLDKAPQHANQNGKQSAANASHPPPCLPRRQRRTVAPLQKKMDACAAAYQAGLNPDLKLEEVCALLNESRATVYRKIKLRLFPPPTKRGRGSFWTMDVIRAYQQGTWTPPDLNGAS